MTSQVLKIELPPRNYFLYHLMKTSLALIASYVAMDFRFSGDYIKLRALAPARLGVGIEELVNDLVRNTYGIKIRLPAGDAQRLQGLSRRSGYIGQLMAGVVRGKWVDVDAFLRNYSNWARSNPQQLLSEWSRAFSSFSNGYPNDTGNISALGSFLPEFVEGMRILGATIGGRSGVEPAAALFRKLRIGIHTTFLGLTALRASRVFYDRNTGYAVHIIPSDDALSQYERNRLLPKFKDRYRGFIEGLKRLRTHSSVIVLLMYLALMQELESEVEIYELIAGGARWEVINYGYGASKPFTTFVQVLRSKGDLGRVLIEKLRNLIEEGLANNMDDIVENIVRAIYQALIGVIDVGTAAYMIARNTYANEDEARHKVLRLRPIDVGILIDAIESSR